ncbi:MAG TPA: hypothetical protein VGF25_12655 [Thermoleophilaceae bacterium]
MARANSGSKSSGSKASGSRRKSARSSRRGSSGARRSVKDVPDYSVIDPSEIDEAVDVYVDAPVVKIDEIKFELDDLQAHLAVLAEAGQFVQINAGAAVRLGKVELDIQGVETQALLEARLHNVSAILARVLTTLDRNPELLESVGKALGDVGGGAHDLLSDTGDTVKSLGKGGEGAVQEIGQGAGRGVAGIGHGAQKGVEGLGQGAGRVWKASGRARSRASRGWGRAPRRAWKGSDRARSRASRAWGRAPDRASRTSARAAGSEARREAARMAQGAKTSGTRRRQGGSSRNGKGRSSGERPALSARRKENDSNLEYRRYVQREEQDPAGPPDVLLDVPELKVDLIHFELDDLDAHVALKAKVLNLVKLNVGVDVHLSMVKLDIKGVEAQVVLKARLDHVTAIVDRLMTSLDRNPELVKGLSKAVAEVGEGAGQAVGKTGDAAKDLGKGAQSALGDVGKGPGRRQATSARARARPSATSARAPARRWASSARAPARPPATSTRSSEASARPSARWARAPRVRSEASPGAAGAAEAAGRRPAQAGPQQAQQQNGGDPAAGGPGTLAKEAAKLLAKELGHAASDEATHLGLAATRKVREMGERRE